MISDWLLPFFMRFMEDISDPSRPNKAHLILSAELPLRLGNNVVRSSLVWETSSANPGNSGLEQSLGRILVALGRDSGGVGTSFLLALFRSGLRPLG